MTATISIWVTDNDGNDPDRIYIVDHHETFAEAVENADRMAAAEYSQTGVVPSLPDGTPYWGKSDENDG